MRDLVRMPREPVSSDEVWARIEPLLVRLPLQPLAQLRAVLLMHRLLGADPGQ
jgi:hypothetical protein